METDVCCNGSFADLVIYTPNSVFCLEVKIDAVEQVGQYAKYQEFFEAQGFRTYMAGLLKSKSANKDPFLDGVTRVCWCELLQKLGTASVAIKSLASDLKALDSQLASSPQGIKVTKPEMLGNKDRNPMKLASDNLLLAQLFKDVTLKMSQSYKNKLWQAGNAPLSVFIWKSDWQTCFVEGWFPKICLSLNKQTRAHSHAEPNFAFAVFLWHTDWCRNREWFLDHRKTILDHCFQQGFRIVRNTKGTWHTQDEWSDPYLETDGLKYVNSFPPFKLNETDYGKREWEDIVIMLKKQLGQIAELVDGLKSKLVAK